MSEDNKEIHGYGFCPECGEPGILRARSPDRHIVCLNKHKYLKKDALPDRRTFEDLMRPFDINPIPGGLEFRKFDQGKAPFHLLAQAYLVGTAEVLAFGAEKYGADNWRKGTEYSRYFSALQRHMWAWWDGQDVDPETGKSHLYHASCCLMFLAEFEEKGLGNDDRPKQIGGNDGQTNN